MGLDYFLTNIKAGRRNSRGNAIHMRSRFVELLRRIRLTVTVLALLLMGFSKFASAQITTNTPAITGYVDDVSQTISYTVPAGSNQLLVVGISLASGDAAKKISNVTYNGIALTRLIEVQSSGGDPRADIWYMVNPQQGTYNIVVTSADANKRRTGVVSFNGVNQSTPISGHVTSEGSSGTPSLIVASDTGDLVMAVVASLASSLTNAGGQTSLWNSGMEGGSDKPGAAATKTGVAGNVTVSWTGSEKWAGIGFNIKVFPTIFASAISGSSFCAGASVQVPYTILGIYNGANVFTAQLSDANGSFASPISIGTLTSTTEGIISATLPAGTSTGTGYRIRVVSSTPAITGTDNGSNITINAIPTITNTADGLTCGTGTVELGATASAGIINWYEASTGGASLGTGISFTTPFISSTTTYYVDATANGCTTAARTAVTATVVTLDITDNAPADLCQYDISMVEAIVSGGSGNYTYQWQVVTPGAENLFISGSTTNDFIWLTSYMLSSDSYDYKLTVTDLDFACVYVEDYSVTISPNVSPNWLISSSSACVSETGVTYAVEYLADADYLWTVTGGAIASGQGSSSITVDWGLNSGSASVEVETTTGTCSNDLYKSVYLYALPTISNTSDGSRCGTGTVTLEATASAGTINWYAAATGGTSLGTGTIFTTPTISATTLFYADATANGCTSSSRTAVTATVLTVPNIFSTVDGSRCGSGTIELGASATAGIISWYAASTGGTSLGTGTSFTTPSITETTIYYVDASTTDCTSEERTQVTATIKPIPTITGTDPGASCEEGEVELGATASAGTVNWYADITGGSSLGTGTGFVSPLLTVSTTYYVDASLNGCTTAERTAIEATISYTYPTITSTQPESRCGTGTVELEASASDGTINWYATPTGGSSLGNGTNFITPSISSTTTYYVDATTVCTTQSRTAVTSTVHDPPIISGTTAGYNCGAGSVSLGASSSTGSINWFSDEVGGTAIGSGSSYTTPIIAVSTTYYVEAEDNYCSSEERTAVLASIYEIPTITSISNGTRIGSGTVALGATSSDGTINWYTSAAGGSSIGTGTTFLTPSISSTTTYYVDAINVCGTTTSRTAVTASVVCFTYVKPISLNNNLSACASTTDTLINFPVLIKITDDPELASTNFGGHVEHSNGYDIFFTDEENNGLDFEIESYSSDINGGDLVAWVKIPSLPTALKSGIKLYYGNSSIILNPSSQLTWADDYVGIWHLNTDENDASQFGNDGTNVGSTNITGKVADGQSFDGINDKIILPNSSSLAITGNSITVSVWAYITGTPSDDTPFVTKFNEGNDERYMLGVDDGSNKVNTRISTSNGYYRHDAGSYPYNQWSYFTMVYNGSTKKAYVNGEEIYSYSISGNILHTSTDSIYIGKRYNLRWFDGLMDEIRISDEAKSADWICTEYANQNNPEDFISVGSEGMHPAILTTTPASRLTAGSVTLGATSSGGTINWYADLLGGTSLAIGTTYTTPILWSTTIYYAEATDVCGTSPSRTPVTASISNYDFVKLITVNDNLSACNAAVDTLTNFPLLVVINDDSDLAHTSHGGNIENSNGYDIIFVDEANNELSFEIESYSSDANGGDLVVWVQMLAIPTTDTSVIKILYGNPNIVADPSSNSTWTSDYAAVWHLNADENDATINANDGQNSGSTNQTGKISDGQLFDGVNDNISIPNSESLAITGSSITVSCWANIAGTPGEDTPFLTKFKIGNDERFMIGVDGGSNKVNSRIKTSSGYSRHDAGSYPYNQWSYFVLVYDGANKKVYVNGSQIYSYSASGTLLHTDDDLINIGKRYDERYFDGAMDEMRVSEHAKSADWICTEYANQNAPELFNTLDDEVLFPRIITTTAASRCGNGSLTIGATATSGTLNWYSSPVGGASLGTGTSFTTPSLSSSTTYYVDATNVGFMSARSPVLATVIPLSVGGTASSNQTICYGESPSDIQLTGQTGTIQWQSSINNINFNDIQGATSSILSSLQIGALINTTYYQAVVSSGDCSSENSSVVTITVDPASVGGTVTSDQDICSGDSPSDLLLSDNTGSIQWQSSTDNVIFNSIVGASTYNLTSSQMGALATTTYYRVVVTNGVCESAISNVVTATVTTMPVATFSYPNNPYCPNAVGVIPGYTGAGEAGTFSSSVGLEFLNASTGEVNTTASAPGNYIVTNTIVAEGGCPDIIETNELIISNELTWTGAVDTDWNNSANWTCGIIPVITRDVQIANVDNQPILSNGAVGTVQHIDINNGGSLTVIENKLQIAGFITGNGIFTNKEGTVELKGTTPQIIPSGVFKDDTIQGLTINNTSGVILLGPLNVTGIVSTTAGVLASNSNLTLVSNKQATALIDGSGTGTVYGNVTMQRYLASGFGYKYFSSPFQAATVSQFADDMDLNADFPSFYKYDESRTPAGWVSYVSATNILNPLEGYALNFGDVNVENTVDATGEVNNGVLYVNVYNNDNDYSQGFNLVGNPYPSPINWDATSGWTKTNIDDALYYFNASSTDQYGGTYSTYINGISSDGVVSNIIPSMQGFFVHVSNGATPVAGILALDNNVRIQDQTQEFMKSEDEVTDFLLRLNAQFTDDSKSVDPMVVYFNNNASEGIDKEYDALKLMNTDVNIPSLYATIKGGTKLSISALPEMDNKTVAIPLGLKVCREGELHFSINNMKNMPAVLRVYFYDAHTGVNQSLLNNEAYKVRLKPGEYLNRFSLKLINNTIDSPYDDPNDVLVVYSSNGIIKANVRSLQNNTGMLMLFDMTGHQIGRLQINEAGNYEMQPHLCAGLYFLRLISGDIENTRKVFVNR